MKKQEREIKFSLGGSRRHSAEDASVFDDRKLVEMSQAEKMGESSRKRQCGSQMLSSPLDHGTFRKL